MFKNSTGPVRDYAIKNIKYNGKRNLVSIIAIALAAFILTAAFTMAVNQLSSYNNIVDRNNGTSAQCYMTDPTDVQKEILKTSPYVESVGESVDFTDRATGIEKDSPAVYFSYEDKTSFSMIEDGIWDVKGDYPEKTYEIMISRNLADNYGNKKIRLGDIITLYNGIKKEEYTVSGIFSSEESGENATAYVSKTFSMIMPNHGGCVYFNCSRSDSDTVEKIKEEVQPTDKQRLVEMASADFSTERLQVMAVMAAIILLIIISAYLLIHNVFYISVSRDVQNYGLLKTLGATKKQLKSIIFRQSLLLGTVGAVLGIAFGLLVSMWCLPSFINKYSDTDVTAFWNFHLSIVLFAFVFTLATVFISAGKPAKLIGSLTSREALNYLAGGKNAKSRRLKSAGRRPLENVMAARNMFANRKRSILVLISLSLGLTIFLSVSTAVNSISPDKYIDSVMDATMTMENNQIVGADGGYELAHGVTDQLAEQVSSSGSVSEVFLQKTLSYTATPTECCNSYIDWISDSSGTSREHISKNFYGDLVSANGSQLYKYRHMNKSDLEKFRSGDYYYINSGYKGRFVPPSKITASLDDGRECTYKFGGYIKMNIFIAGNFLGMAPNLIIPQSEFERVQGSNTIGYDKLYAYSEKGREHEAIESVKEMMEGNVNVDFESVEDARNDSNFMMVLLNVVGNGASMVFIFLGIMNFLNIISAGILARRHELSMLESIGMTKKQILKMLIREGLYYYAISVAFTFTFGLAFSVFVVRTISKVVEFASFSFPYVYVAVVLLSILAICIFVPVVTYRGISTNELSQRLRYE